MGDFQSSPWRGDPIQQAPANYQCLGRPMLTASSSDLHHPPFTPKQP